MGAVRSALQPPEVGCVHFFCCGQAEHLAGLTALCGCFWAPQSMLLPRGKGMSYVTSQKSVTSLAGLSLAGDDTEAHMHQFETMSCGSKTTDGTQTVTDVFDAWTQDSYKTVDAISKSQSSAEGMFMTNVKSLHFPRTASPDKRMEQSDSFRNLTVDGAGAIPMANKMAEFMWPKLAEFAKNLIATRIEPEVRKALGSIGRGVAFDASTMELGNKPVKIKKLRANCREQTMENGEATNIVIRARVEWEADVSIRTHIQVGLRLAELGLKSIEVSGTLVIELVAMTSSPPFFRGCRFYFVNAPRISLRYRGAMLTSLVKIRMLKKKILEVVTEEISRKLVVPNRMGFLLDPQVDIFAIMRPAARGVLTLTLWNAKNLLAMDVGFMQSGKSDPYAIVQCGAARFRSPTVFKTLNPELNFKVTFQIFAVIHEVVCIELWDEDALKEHDFLGSINLPVIDLVGWVSDIPKVLDLCDLRGEPGDRGTICLSAEWRKLLTSASSKETIGKQLAGNACTAVISVGVYKILGVPEPAEEKAFWLEVECSCVRPASDGVGLAGKKSKSVVLPNPALGQSVSMRQRIAHGGRASVEQAFAPPRPVTPRRRKRELLEKYGVSEEDMREILDCPNPAGSYALGDPDEDSEEEDVTRCPLEINEGWDFVVDRAQDAVITFRFKSQGHFGDVDVGICEYAVRGHVEAQAGVSGRRHARGTKEFLQLGQRITLQARVQVRVLGEPSTRP